MLTKLDLHLLLVLISLAENIKPWRREETRVPGKYISILTTWRKREWRKEVADVPVSKVGNSLCSNRLTLVLFQVHVGAFASSVIPTWDETEHAHPSVVTAFRAPWRSCPTCAACHQKQISTSWSRTLTLMTSLWRASSERREVKVSALKTCHH